MEQTRRVQIFTMLALFAAIAAPVLTARSAASSGAVELTAQEREWLAEHPVIRFAADPEYQPIESLDENGQLVGISADYLKLLESKLGIRFEIVPTASWDEAMAMARSRKVDMLSAATKTLARSKYMLFTTPHIELPGAIIIRNAARNVSGLDQLRGKKVGVVSSYVWQEWITRDHPDIDLQPVADMQTGLLLTSFGQLDAMVGNLATATHFIQKLGVTNLRVTEETGYFARLAIATRQDWPELNTILQKAVSSISGDERQAILDRWIKLETRSRLDTRTLLLGLLILIAVIGLAVAGNLAWNYSLRKMVRRQSESLRDSEARFRAIVEDQTEFIGRSLPGAHALTFVNEAYALCFGKTPAELIGTSFMDHVPEAERAGIDARFATFSPENPVVQIERSDITADGEVRWHQWTNRAIFDDGGDIKEIQAVGRDITEVKRAADAIRLSEEKFSKAFRAGPDSILITRMSDAVIIDSNDRFLIRTGRTREDTVGRPVSDVLTWENPEDRATMMEALAATGECTDLETDFRYADGKLINCLVSARTIEVDGAMCALTITRDITGRKRAADAIRLSEEKFSKAFRAGPERSVITRISNGTIVDLNDRFLARIGRDRADVIGLPASDLVTWVRPEDLEELLKAIKTTGECTDLEADFRFDDGSLANCLVSAQAIEIDGEPCILTATRDITARKQAELALYRSEERLRDAIESITDGFIHYDADKRLIQSNAKYREFYPWIEDVLVPGTHLADIARTAAERGQDAEPIADVDQWVEHRLEEFETGRQMHEQHLRDGRWLLCSENRTRDGGIVGIRTDITERKWAEVALRETEERLRDAIESISEGFILFDADDRFVLCNDKYRDIYPSLVDSIRPGVTPVELARAVVETGAVRGSAETIEGWMETRLAQHRTAQGSHEQQLSDGRWILCSERRTSSGGTVGIRTDITDRKLAENILRDNEQHMRDYAEASADWFWEMDADLRFTYLSPNVERIVGVAPEWHYGKTRADLLGDGYDETIWNQHLEDLRERRPFRNFEYLRVGKGVDPLWLRTSGVPVFAGDGAFLGYRGTGSDITELKMREEALRESEERFKAVVDNSPSIIVLKDTESRLLMVNRMFEQVNGITSEEARGKTPDQFFSAEFADALLAMDRMVVSDRRVVERELDLKDRDGRVKTRIVTKFPVCGPAGNVIAIGGIITDNTERKKVEEELRQAQKMEVVGQLTGGVAHDFNNLLMIISGNLELAMESLEDNAEVAGLVDRAGEAAERGATLTHRLLAFSRKQTLMPGVVDLDELVASLTNLLRRTLTEIVEVKTVSTEGLWPCEADSSQIESALLNLVINARDAMPDGGKLTIETANVTIDDHFATAQGDVTPGHYIMVAVSDTGAGMTRHVIDHAFEPFFTTKEVGSGSGLGLSMIYGFVKQSGGHVAIYSEEGVGTTVRMYFPRSSGQTKEARAEQPELEPRARGETILVVEDDPDVRALTVTLLNDLGYHVLQAPDAHSALAILDGTPRLDLLFTDVVLPGGMSGPTLADEAKHRIPATSVLYMSGYTDNAIHHQGRLDGNIELLNKPFPKAALARKVRSVLDKAEA